MVRLVWASEKEEKILLSKRSRGEREMIPEGGGRHRVKRVDRGGGAWKNVA